jgi:hypothetical protein
VVSYTTFSPLPFDYAQGGLVSVALSVPFGPTRYVAPRPEPYGSRHCPEELGLSSPILIEAIIYSALATLTQFSLNLSFCVYLTN